MTEARGRSLRNGTIIQRMEMREVIEALGPEGVVAYLHDAHGNPDFNHLRERLLTGDTVKEAAKAVAETAISDLTQRSYHTLLYHARDIRRIILEELSTSIPDLLSELQVNGTVKVGADRVPDLRRALDEQGLRVIEETHYTLVGREE